VIKVTNLAVISRLANC